MTESNIDYPKIIEDMRRIYEVRILELIEEIERLRKYDQHPYAGVR